MSVCIIYYLDTYSILNVYLYLYIYKIIKQKKYPLYSPVLWKEQCKWFHISIVV